MVNGEALFQAARIGYKQEYFAKEGSWTNTIFYVLAEMPVMTISGRDYDIATWARLPDGSGFDPEKLPLLEAASQAVRTLFDAAARAGVDRERVIKEHHARPRAADAIAEYFRSVWGNLESRAAAVDNGFLPEQSRARWAGDMHLQRERERREAAVENRAAAFRREP